MFSVANVATVTHCKYGALVGQDRGRVNCNDKPQGRLIKVAVGN